MRKSDYINIGIALAKGSVKTGVSLSDLCEHIFNEINPTDLMQNDNFQRYCEMSNAYTETLNKLYEDKEQQEKTPLQVAYEIHSKEALGKR